MFLGIFLRRYMYQYQGHSKRHNSPWSGGKTPKSMCDIPQPIVLWYVRIRFTCGWGVKKYWQPFMDTHLLMRRFEACPNTMPNKLTIPQHLMNMIHTYSWGIKNRPNWLVSVRFSKSECTTTQLSSQTFLALCIHPSSTKRLSSESWVQLHSSFMLNIQWWLLYLKQINLAI